MYIPADIIVRDYGTILFSNEVGMDSIIVEANAPMLIVYRVGTGRYYLITPQGIGYAYVGPESDAGKGCRQLC